MNISRKVILLVLVLTLVLPILTYSQQLLPIGGAKVVAEGDNGLGEATTDANGYFRIEEGIGPGTYTVTVSAKGYLSKVLTNIQVSSGEEKDLGDIELEPSAIIEGVVKTPEGEPAGGVPVVLLNQKGEIVAQTVTANDGSFTFDSNVATGKYRVRAYAFSFQGFKFKTVMIGFMQVRIPVPKQGETYLEGYAKGETSVNAAQGKKTSGVTVVLGRSGIVSGRVTDKQGSPVEGVIVAAFPATMGREVDGFYAITDADGRYRIANNLPTGKYNVTILFPKGYVWSFRDSKSVNVVAGEETSGVDFQLEKSGIISGTVEFSDGAPAANATVIAFSEDGKYYAFATSNIDGSFRIDWGLGTGTYQVMAYGGPNLYSQPINVKVTAGKETSGVKIKLLGSGNPVAVVKGKVTDKQGKPLANIKVECPYGFTYTGSDGKYTLYATLPAAEKKVTVTVTASGRGYKEAQKSGITLEAGKETTGVDFQLEKIREAVIKGRVVGKASAAAKKQVTISLSASKTEISLGESSAITGTTNPPITGKINILVSTDGSWVKIATVNVVNGQFTFEFKPKKIGLRKLKAVWPGNEQYSPAESEPITINVVKPAAEKVTPNIQISASTTSAKVGDTVTISGTISPFKAKTSVKIVVTAPSGTKEYTVESSDGTFTFNLKVDAAGTWKVKARVPASAAYNPAESNEVSITVSEEKKCIIATVTFGSEVSPEVNFLRGFRDNLIRRTYLGERFYQAFDAFYYSWSTPVAMYIAAHPILKIPVKLAIYPLIGALKLTALVSMPLFQWSPELASLFAGFVASTLLAIIYLVPPVTLAAYLAKRKGRRIILSNSVINMLWVSVGLTLTFIMLGMLVGADYLLTAATSAYVLLTMSASAVTLSKIILKKARIF